MQLPSKQFVNVSVPIRPIVLNSDDLKNMSDKSLFEMKRILESKDKNKKIGRFGKGWFGDSIGHRLARLKGYRKYRR
jgi:hypothetical protein